MTEGATYPIPAGEHRREEVVERSRFIASVGPAASRDEAIDFIRRISAEFSGATHNCHAFLVGPPGTTACVGLSDDGEPHGTAGRPMLNALTHGGVGDVAAVVTRYFGGRKLGRGGLVRAYGGVVSQALSELRTTTRISWVRVAVEIPYPLLETISQLYPRFGVEVEREEYAESVSQELRLPADALAGFRTALIDCSGGRVEPEPR